MIVYLSRQMNKTRQDRKYLLFLSVKPFMETRCVYLTTACTNFLLLRQCKYNPLFRRRWEDLLSISVISFEGLAEHSLESRPFCQSTFSDLFITGINVLNQRNRESRKSCSCFRFLSFISLQHIFMHCMLVA